MKNKWGLDSEIDPIPAERSRVLLKFGSTCQRCGRSVSRNHVRVYVVEAVGLLYDDPDEP